MTTKTRCAAALPTIEAIREAVIYDPDSGCMRWRTTRSSRAIGGAEVGYVREDGYRTFCLNYKVMLVSRVAWALTFGEWPRYEIGHINKNAADDRIANLIDRPRSDHHASCNEPNCDARDQVLGVRKRGKRWHARYKGLHVGTFQTAAEASAAYWAFKQHTGKLYRAANPISKDE